MPQGAPSPLRVVVVGRGLAGLSAAIACARQGSDVVLLERGTGQSPHGDNIIVGANASKLLYRWGLGEELWERSARGGWWLLKDSQGKGLSEEDLREFPSRFDAPLLSGHRAQYLGALGAEARELRVDTRVCTEVVDYFDSPDSPGVLTKNGEVIYGDVILVADGVNSPGRDVLSKYQAVPDAPVDGYSVHRAAMRSDAIRADPQTAHLLDGNIRTWIGKDAHAIIAPLDEGRQISFSITHHSINGEASTSWRDRKPIQQVLNIIEGWDPALVRAVQRFPSALNWVIKESPPAEEWISDSGKICFIGDAVHSLMPSSFQGGSQAIEGGAAVALALSLAGGRPCDVPLALKVFQAIRRPRIMKAHEMGKKQRQAWHGHHLTQDADDLPLLATAFYDFDVEAFLIANFQWVATTFDPAFELEETVKANARSKLGLGRGVKARFEGEKPLW